MGVVTHDMSKTSLASILNGMKQRCYNPNRRSYKNYGGKGITICEDWLSDTNNFYKWALANGYEEGLSIERLDNDKGYYPDNCTWIPLEDQYKNRSYEINQGESHGMAVLNWEEVRKMRNMKLVRGDRVKLAQKFGVTKACITSILNYKSWREQ